MAWQVQEAKQKFSELVERAISDGPQTVTRRGVDVVVVMSVDEYRRIVAPRKDFKEFLMSGPDMSILDLERDQSLFRDVEL